MKSTMTDSPINGEQLRELTADELDAVSGGGFHLWHGHYGISVTGEGITIGLGNGPMTLWFDAVK